jgi:hypothetical protein
MIDVGQVDEIFQEYDRDGDDGVADGQLTLDEFKVSKRLTPPSPHLRRHRTCLSDPRLPSIDIHIMLMWSTGFYRVTTVGRV